MLVLLAYRRLGVYKTSCRDADGAIALGDMMKKFWAEFREFAIKGNVVDLAVGVVIGGAFGKISASLVADIIMPPLGFLIGRVDFKNLKLVLRAPFAGLTPVTINYGNFINECVNFLIVAFALFLMIRLINRLKHLHKAEEDRQKAAAAAVAPPAELSREEVLLTEIRDLLKIKNP